MVVHGLQQRRLEALGQIEHAVSPVREPARAVGADMRERRHQVGCAGPSDPPVGRHKVKRAQRLHQPRIGLLLGRDQQRPVLRVGDVLEQVDGRKQAADDPSRAPPLNMAGRDLDRINHQPPRSASR